MWIKKRLKITSPAKLSDVLQMSGLDAFSYPVGKGERNLSREAWDLFRHNIADEILQQCDIFIKTDRT